MHFQRGDHEAAARITRQVVEIGGSHGFTNWLDATLVLREATAEEPVNAQVLATLGRQLAQYRGGSAWRHVFSLCLFAELCLAGGCLEEGETALASIGGTDRWAFWAPEIRRIEGELNLVHGRPAEAGERFRVAIQLARERAEKSLELRATTCLARLLDGQGRRDEARAELAEIYGWFTEGFDTRDLQEARVLLDKLS